MRYVCTKLLSCLLLVVSIGVIPQAILSSTPADASTTTVTLTTIYPIGADWCGVDAAGIPFTGPVHIDFHSTSVAMDIYIVQNLMYIPCGLHLSPTELTSYSKGEGGGSCIFANWSVTNADFDVNLPSESKYAIFVIAWGNPANINGATATIVMNVTPLSTSTTQVRLTPFTSYNPPSTSHAVTATTSLQMPQPPQSANLQSANKSEVALLLAVIAAIALYLLVRRHAKHA